MKTIFDMHVGETGTISDMKAIDLKKRHRFMDLGIAPNAKLVLLKKINFNNLYIIEVDDVEICIRQADAKNILVQI
ncbi:MAG: FeoA domain [Haloplasmataceae bacterium]|jgi:ferrous iron transport protein A|nr:FeoA domain [Haloplasmataceae bacterium]